MLGRPEWIAGGRDAIYITYQKAVEQVFFGVPPRAATGRVLSPNAKVDPKLFPDYPFAVAEAVRGAGDRNVARYDLSDSFPPSLGSTDRRGCSRSFRTSWEGLSWHGHVLRARRNGFRAVT